MGVSFNATLSRQYRVENTFLYVDELGKPDDGLCYAAGTSIPEPCPLGFFSSSSSSSMECAMEARENGLYNVHLDGVDYLATLDPVQGVVQCRVQVSFYSFFRGLR